MQQFLFYEYSINLNLKFQTIHHVKTVIQSNNLFHCVMQCLAGEQKLEIFFLLFHMFIYKC